MIDNFQVIIKNVNGEWSMVNGEFFKDEMST